jgi:hypothetical protein
MINDLTIILQGRCDVEPIKLWIENYSEWNVIISTWIDSDLPFEFPHNWKIIKSEYPERYGNFQNLDYQVTSTLNGLQEVKTKYVVKLRADEYWSNMEVVYNRMKTDENKVLCGSMFFRPLGLYAYHISDHIICGTTENLKVMFEGTYHILVENIRLNNCSESLLGCGFVFLKEKIDALAEFYNLHLYSDMYLKKWFHIIDVNELKPYIGTQNSPVGRLYFYSNYDNCGCITEI